MNLETLISLIPKNLFNLYKVLVRKLRILLFRLRDRGPVLDETKARSLVSSLLAGDIISVISYRDFDSPRVQLAAVRCSSVEEHDCRIYVLEQFGESFRKIWKSETISRTPSLEIRDIDADGRKELIFEEESYGTGAGTRLFMVYSRARGQIFQISEFYNWQDAAGPVLPEIDIQPDCVDKKFLKALEKQAIRRGFLRANPLVDFDRPEFAVQRWHKENGKKRNGVVNVHYYEGYPTDRSSRVAQLDTEETLWIAYFKGPLCAYSKPGNQHFIAFSPAWIYNWVTCLAFHRDRLWFGLHCEPGILSFRCRDRLLAHYATYKGSALPETGMITFEDDCLVINRELRISLQQLTDLHTAKLIP